jgi:tetratricopeptide (TPR) repeat protein
MLTVGVFFWWVVCLPVAWALFESDHIVPQSQNLTSKDKSALTELLGKLIESSNFATATVLSRWILREAHDSELAIVAQDAMIRMLDLGFMEPVVSWVSRTTFDLGLSMEGPSGAATELSPGQGNLFEQMAFYRMVTYRLDGLERWASFYESALKASLQTRSLYKWDFYQALWLMGKSQWVDAEGKLRDLLKKLGSTDNEIFVKKVARTLGRLYFEQGKYKEALEIFDSFLLKTTYQQPTDWLEAAWSLFYLKDYNRALGLLYNYQQGSTLSAISTHKPLDLEEFILRGLIHQKTCSTEGIAALSDSFNRQFQKVISGIKSGESLTGFPILLQLKMDENHRFLQLKALFEQLEKEKAAQKANPLAGLSPLARARLAQCMDQQVPMIRALLEILKSEVLENSARALILMDENLQFMQFNVAREKFNPDTVFQTDKVGLSLEKSLDKQSLPTLRFWPQSGGFWYNERLIYEGKLQNACNALPGS